MAVSIVKANIWHHVKRTVATSIIQSSHPVVFTMRSFVHNRSRTTSQARLTSTAHTTIVGTQSTAAATFGSCRWRIIVTRRTWGQDNYGRDPMETLARETGRVLGEQKPKTIPSLVAKAWCCTVDEYCKELMGHLTAAFKGLPKAHIPAYSRYPNCEHVAGYSTVPYQAHEINKRILQNSKRAKWRSRGLYLDSHGQFIALFRRTEDLANAQKIGYLQDIYSPWPSPKPCLLTSLPSSA
jgi:hypothetical protein